MAYIYGERKPRPRPEPPTAEQLAEREAERQARRQAIRRQLAERQILELRANELRREVAATEARLEGLAASHEAAMAPLQAELKAANESIVQALAARHEAPAKVTAKRRQLLDELAAANRQLAADLEVEKTLLRQLKRDADAAAIAAAGFKTTESKLTQPDVANPELLADAFVAKQANQWAAARVESSRKTLREQQAALADVRNRENWDADDQRQERIYEARIRRWQAECQAAEAALAAASAESEAAVQRMVDE